MLVEVLFLPSPLAQNKSETKGVETKKISFLSDFRAGTNAETPLGFWDNNDFSNVPIRSSNPVVAMTDGNFGHG